MLGLPTVGERKARRISSVSVDDFCLRVGVKSIEVCFEKKKVWPDTEGGHRVGSQYWQTAKGTALLGAHLWLYGGTVVLKDG